MSSRVVPVLCEPTQLYNILSQRPKSSPLLDDTYLALFDARTNEEYSESHILLAKLAKQSVDGKYRIPFKVHLPTTLHCVIYDGRTVSIMEDTPAVRLATQLSSAGTKTAVKILKGGYERFSAEYPSLRKQKIMYTPLELTHLPTYPNEIIPLFLYLGDRRHAYNASLNYDLKIHHHLRLGNDDQGLPPSFPGMINELHISVADSSEVELLPHFEEIVEYIESHRKQSERILVFSELGISRAVTAVLAYLIKRDKCPLKDAYAHVKRCREHIQPLQAFLHQLCLWEEQVLGKRLTDISLL